MFLFFLYYATKDVVAVTVIRVGNIIQLIYHYHSRFSINFFVFADKRNPISIRRFIESSYFRLQQLCRVVHGTRDWQITYHFKTPQCAPKSWCWSLAVGTSIHWKSKTVLKVCLLIYNVPRRGHTFTLNQNMTWTMLKMISRIIVLGSYHAK